MEKSTIAEFYRDRSVFITGATGFLGKVLVEKLLRSCPDIKTLYLLIRPKAGNDIRTRLHDFAQHQIFDVVRRERPGAMNKLVAVAGDVTMEGLGLVPSDVQLLIDNVSVVFNSAATIRFDEELRKAVEMNVKGPKKLMEICHRMTHLEVLIHVSTAYNNLDKENIEEIIYPTSMPPRKLLEIVDVLDDSQLKAITNQLVGNCPNTYAYTKAFAEQLLRQEHGQIPVAIVRPTIVTAAMKEPLPGWIDNLNGPTGLIAGAGKGFLRVVRVREDLIGDLIPVEFPIHLMIAAAWHTATTKPDDIAVYNCSTGDHNPLTWKTFNDICEVAWRANPTKDMLWYPTFRCQSNYVLHQLSALFYHYVPAYILDTLARVTGKKPQLVRFYDKADRAIACLSFYMLRQWRFISQNSIDLSEKLSAIDQSTFYFDVREIDWHKYVTNYVLGARHYILKDDISTVPIAKRNLNRLYWAHQLLLLTLAGVIFFIGYQFMRLFF